MNGYICHRCDKHAIVHRGVPHLCDVCGRHGICVYGTIPEAKPKEPERMINGLPASEYHRLYNAEWRKNHPDYWKAWKANQPTR